MVTQVTLGSGVVDSAAGLKLRTNGSTEAVDISTGQVVTLAKDAVVNGLTVGKGAGAVSTNTAVGASALAANTTGAGNTGVGNLALSANTTGLGNTAVGANISGTIYGPLLLNTTGSANTAIAPGALSFNTGDSNTAVGYGSLYQNTSASSNTAVGRSALYSNTTASNNTAVGYQAGYSNTTGIQNQFFGNLAGYYVTTGSKNTILGCYNGNQGGLDIRTASNYIVLSDGDGNIGAYWSQYQVMYVPAAYTSTTAAAANLAVSASGAIQRSTSALKYKQDIRDVEDFDINALRPVRYKSKCANDDQTKDHLGLIADEAAEAGFEELVTRGADGEIEGFQYERLTVVLLKKLQVLETEIKSLKGQA